MIQNNYFTWERIRKTHRLETEIVDVLQYIDDLLQYTKEGRTNPQEAVETIKKFLNKTSLPVNKKEIEKPFIKIEFPNHLSYETGTDVNIPILKDNKVVGFVRYIYETRCIGYIFTKCMDIIPEILVDEKQVMSFVIEDK